MSLTVAFEGGGIRGALSARIFQRLAIWPGAGHELMGAEQFAGSSTGAIIACGLAAGIAPARILEFYVSEGPKIFAKSIEHDIDSLWSLNGPRYSSVPLKAALTKVFGDRTLGELERDVLITTCDLTTRRPIALTRRSRPNLSCVDACLCSCAAQTYFRPHLNCIDGGNAANNASLWAALLMRSQRAGALEGIRVLSIGTGNANRPALKAGNGGAREWLANDGIGLMIEMPAALMQELCAMLLGGHFRHVDCHTDCAMDDASDIEGSLVAPADALDLTEEANWLLAEVAAPIGERPCAARE